MTSFPDYNPELVAYQKRHIKKLKEVLAKLGAKKLIRLFIYAYEDIKDSGAVKKNESLKGVYNNRRCFILGTGVSLNEIDLSQLANEYSFGCGYLFLHKNFKELNIDFYADADPFRNCKKDVLMHYFSLLNEKNENPETIFFLTVNNKSFIEKHGIFQNRNVHYIKASQSMLEAAVQSNNLAERITFLDGSIFFMIAAAIYMGFKELYLCGCGYTYKPVLEWHFYGEYPDISLPGYKKSIFSRDIPEKERLKMIKNFAAEHGVEIYNVRQEGPFDVVTFVRNLPVDKRHQIIKEFAETNGARIYNVVPDGFESPVYEKVSWGYIVKNILPETAFVK